MESTDTLRNAHAAQRHVSSVPSSCTDKVTTEGRTKSQNQCIVATAAQCIDRPRFATFHAVTCKRIGVLSGVPKLMQKAQGPTTQEQNRYNWYFQTVASFRIVAKLRYFVLGIVIATSVPILVRDPILPR